ncbi:MAG: plastocyanin/azurin family copper-binding protein [Candidatus Binatia bacterium]
MRRRQTIALGFAAAMIASVLLATSSEAVHFFRGDEIGGCGSGCCPANGDIGYPLGIPDGLDIGAEVLVFHNTYHDAANLLPLIVRIKAGQAVRWRWTSSHCHSVTADDGAFDSGFFYPQNPPFGQSVVLEGAFDYPLPDGGPTLTYTRVFDTPGNYVYHCVHHQIIGMVGVVIVDP